MKQLSFEVGSNSENPCLPSEELQVRGGNGRKRRYSRGPTTQGSMEVNFDSKCLISQRNSPRHFSKRKMGCVANSSTRTVQSNNELHCLDFRMNPTVDREEHVEMISSSFSKLPNASQSLKPLQPRVPKISWPHSPEEQTSKKHKVNLLEPKPPKRFPRRIRRIDELRNEERLDQILDFNAHQHPKVKPQRRHRIRQSTLTTGLLSPRSLTARSQRGVQSDQESSADMSCDETASVTGSVSMSPCGNDSNLNFSWMNIRATECKNNQTPCTKNQYEGHTTKHSPSNQVQQYYQPLDPGRMESDQLAISKNNLDSSATTFDVPNERNGCYSWHSLPLLAPVMENSALNETLNCPQTT